MKAKRQRRRWNPADKLRIVLESMNSDARLAEICRREGLSPNLVYQWRRTLLKSGDAIFVRKSNKNGEDAKVEKLAAENDRMKGVIAEVVSENLELKKTLLD